MEKPKPLKKVGRTPKYSDKKKVIRGLRFHTSEKYEDVIPSTHVSVPLIRNLEKKERWGPRAQEPWRKGPDYIRMERAYQEVLRYPYGRPAWGKLEWESAAREALRFVETYGKLEDIESMITFVKGVVSDVAKIPEAPKSTDDKQASETRLKLVEKYIEYIKDILNLKVPSNPVMEQSILDFIAWGRAEYAQPGSAWDMYMTRFKETSDERKETFKPKEPLHPDPPTPIPPGPEPGKPDYTHNPSVQQGVAMTQGFDSIPETKDKNDLYFRDPGNIFKNSRTNLRSKSRVGKINSIATKVAPVTKAGWTRVSNRANQLTIIRTEPYCVITPYLAPTILNYNSTASRIPAEGALNPGYSFPWARQFAHLYEKYRVTSCVFHYVPSCSKFASGTVCLAYDVDVTDDDSSDGSLIGIQGLNYQHTGPILDGFDFHIPKSCLLEMFGTPNSGADKWIRAVYNEEDETGAPLFEFGRLWIGVQGCDSATVAALVAGQVWVTYEMELIQPHLNLEPSRYVSDKYTAGVIATPANFFGNTTGVWATREGATVATAPSSIMGMRYLSLNQIQVSTPMQLMFVSYMKGTVFLPGTAPTVSITSGSGSYSLVAWEVNSAATQAIWVGIVTTVKDFVTVSFGSASCATTISENVVRFTIYTYNLSMVHPSRKLNIENGVCLRKSQRLYQENHLDMEETLKEEKKEISIGDLEEVEMPRPLSLVKQNGLSLRKK